jgi:hypothetical protein
MLVDAETAQVLAEVGISANRKAVKVDVNVVCRDINCVGIEWRHQITPQNVATRFRYFDGKF